jgi:predicted enzyme related to lactoylglutathione lyase
MRNRHRIALALALAMAAAGCAARGGGEMERDGGAFLGQVKPVLYVADVKSSAVFYRDVLGFGLLAFADDERAPYYAEMAAGRQKFGLHAPRTDAERARVGKQRLYFRVRDVAACRERIQARGGSPGPIERTAWMTMCVVRDADGHEIVIAETDAAVHTIDPW